jgi:hypothetical protein
LIVLEYARFFQKKYAYLSQYLRPSRLCRRLHFSKDSLLVDLPGDLLTKPGIDLHTGYYEG